MALYFATVLAGLEFVLADEIRVKIADVKLQNIERGKVHFASDLPLASLLVLQTADNLYKLVRKFQVGPHRIHLADIEREISQCDLSWIESNRPGFISCKVNASRSGKHTYSRFEAAEAAARGVARRDSRFRLRDLEMHETEFRLDIHDEYAIFALRLTDASFRYRGHGRVFTLAALRPTVAHALVWLSHPRESDVFLDPCCGSGTVLSERLVYPYGLIDGGDLSAQAVEASMHNAGSHARVTIRQWDARRLPIDSGSVDIIVTNLPFGRKIAADENISALYADVFKEMKRVLNEDGRALCLTDADAAFAEAAEREQLQYEKGTTLSLKGLQPTLYSIGNR